jgi:hypothetical protein
VPGDDDGALDDQRFHEDSPSVEVLTSTRILAPSAGRSPEQLGAAREHDYLLAAFILSEPRTRAHSHRLKAGGRKIGVRRRAGASADARAKMPMLMIAAFDPMRGLRRVWSDEAIAAWIARLPPR